MKVSHRLDLTPPRVAASVTVLMVITSLGLFSGCKSAEPAPPPPPSVTITNPIEKEVTDWDEYSGHLESPETVSVAARVSGIIVKATFDEGSLVKAGDTLFEIDDRPYVAQLKSKTADVARAQAVLTQAELHFKRYEKIRGTNAVSQEDLDEARASLKQSQAELSVAQAAEDIAQLDLEWTRVVSPISGRVSKKYVTEGNLISAGNSQNPTALTSIASQDPVYAYINVPEREYLSYREIEKVRRKAEGADKRVPCQIKLENEKQYSRECTIDFIDNRVTPATGTIQIRGVIPNKEGDLTPGLFINMRIPGSIPYRAILVPDAAIGTDQTTKFLLVVGADEKVELRPVKLGVLFGPLRAIVSGITPSDRIVIAGLQAARPGLKVNATQAPFPDDTPAGGSPTPTATTTATGERR